MAYFDNPNNRKSWEQAMVILREERQRRMAKDDTKMPSPVQSFRDLVDSRTPVGFDELVQEKQPVYSSEQLVENEPEITVGREPSQEIPEVKRGRGL